MTLPPGISPVILLRSTTNGIATGLYLTGSSVFFILYIGLSPAQVGLGLSVAWFISTVLMIPFGMIADRYGGRVVWLVGTTASVAVFCAFPFAHTYWQFQVTVVLQLLLAGLGSAGSARYFGDLLAEGSRVRGGAFLRTTSNIGMAVGAGIAGVAISVEERPGYLAIVLVTAAVTAVEAVLIAWAVPHLDRPHRPTTTDTPWFPVAIRDGSFVAISLLRVILNLDGPILSVILPLWILTRTDGPSWLVAGTVLANMALTALFQIPFSRGVESVPSGARALARSGVAMAAACVAFAASATTSEWITVLCIAAGSVALTAGELLGSAATWAIRYGLAPEDRRGEYVAVFSLGGYLSWVVGPAALTLLVVSGGLVGWLVLAGVFLAASVAAGPMVAWAARRDRLGQTRAPGPLAT